MRKILRLDVLARLPPRTAKVQRSIVQGISHVPRTRAHVMLVTPRLVCSLVSPRAPSSPIAPHAPCLLVSASRALYARPATAAHRKGIKVHCAGHLSCSAHSCACYACHPSPCVLVSPRTLYAHRSHALHSPMCMPVSAATHLAPPSPAALQPQAALRWGTHTCMARLLLGPRSGTSLTPQTRPRRPHRRGLRPSTLASAIADGLFETAC